MAIEFTRATGALPGATTVAATADTDVLTATPLETAEGSDEMRFAIITGAVIAGAIGVWWWMGKKKRKNGKRRRRTRGYLL